MQFIKQVNKKAWTANKLTLQELVQARSMSAFLSLISFIIHNFCWSYFAAIHGHRCEIRGSWLVYAGWTCKFERELLKKSRQIISQIFLFFSQTCGGWRVNFKWRRIRKWKLAFKTTFCAPMIANLGAEEVKTSLRVWDSDYDFWIV